MNARTTAGRQLRAAAPRTVSAPRTAVARRHRRRGLPGPGPSGLPFLLFLRFLPLLPFLFTPHRIPVPPSAHPTARAIRVRRSPR